MKISSYNKRVLFNSLWCIGFAGLLLCQTYKKEYMAVIAWVLYWVVGALLEVCVRSCEGAAKFN
jgi:hypothetical protein